MADWGDAPTILIFGDSEEGFVAASEAAVAQGGRVAAALPLAQASDRLERQVAVDLVLLDVSADHGPVLDQLLRRIEEGAAARRFSGVVSITAELVDVTTAQIGHAGVSILVGRDEQRLNRAIANGLARTRLELREGNAGRDRAVRPALDNIEPETDGRDGIAEDGGAAAYHDLSADIRVLTDYDLDRAGAPMIRRMIRARRLRSQFFGPGLFADPAWDILLDLMAARFEGRSVAVSSLCIAAAVPPTTALRWIKQLTGAGLLCRVADPLDGRRVFIELTDSAVATLTGYFASLTREQAN